MMERCRYARPNIVWECFDCLEDSRAKCCSMLGKRLFERTARGWAEERLASRSWAEFEDLSERVLDAPTIEDLLK
jgi:hypothetical protein